MKCFSTLEEKFRVSARPCKLKTKLEVILRYYEVVRSHFMKWPKQAEKSRTCAPNLVPKLVHNLIVFFSFLELPSVTVAQSANPSS